MIDKIPVDYIKYATYLICIIRSPSVLYVLGEIESVTLGGHAHYISHIRSLIYIGIRIDYCSILITPNKFLICWL